MFHLVNMLHALALNLLNVVGNDVAYGVTQNLLIPISLEPIGVQLRVHQSTFDFCGGTIVEIRRRARLAICAIGADFHELETFGDG